MGTVEYVSPGEGYPRAVAPHGPDGGFPGVPVPAGNRAVKAGPERSLGTESELIGRVRVGDPEAMAVLYSRYREPGLRFARSLMAGVQEAEDVFHEGFTKTVGAIRNGFGPTDVFAPYLNTSIRSVAMTFYKKSASERPAPGEDLDPGPVDDPGLETVLSVFEHERIAVAMRSLPERWRTVLWHAEVLGEWPREIAPRLGIEANAVSALLIRARAGLRAAYEQQTGPGAGARSASESS